jgi:integral membrane sensor domain MASE1
MFRYLPLVLVVVALLVLVAIPPIDRATLWWGIPPLVVCSVVGVALLTPLLALVEFTRRHDDEEPRR